MNLSSYIQSFPKDERKAVRDRLAAACGVTEGAVKHWANGTRGVPAKHFRALIAESGGMVSISDLLESIDAA